MVNRIEVHPIPPWETQTEIYRIRDPIVLNDRELNRSLVHGTSPKQLGYDVNVGHASSLFFYGTRGQPNALNTKMLSCIPRHNWLKLFRTAREDISSVAGAIRPHQRRNQDGFIPFWDLFGLEKWQVWFLRKLRQDRFFSNGVLCPLLKKIYRGYRMIWKGLHFLNKGEPINK